MQEIYVACRVIEGLTEPGRGCSISATCKRPDGVATAECIKSVWQVIEILPEGAPCPFPSGSVPVCDAGLACDAPGLGSEGKCVKAIETGATCDASALAVRKAVAALARHHLPWQCPVPKPV